MDQRIVFYKAALSKKAMLSIFRCSGEHPGTNMAKVQAMFFAA